MNAIFDDVLSLLTTFLDDTDLKGKVVPPLTTGQANKIVKALSDKELEDLKNGLNKGVEENNWMDLIGHRKLRANVNQCRINPPGQILSLATIDDKIQTKMELIRPRIERFLRNSHLPTWTPPDSIVDADHRKFLCDLRIPTYENGNPSLLLHNLDKADKRAVDEIFGNERHTFICNTSGSGKTRRIMEGLSQNWGFYFVAAKDTNAVGVYDMQYALASVKAYSTWTEVLPNHSKHPEARANSQATNDAIAHKALMKVLAARVVVFEQFLQLAVQMDGHLQDKHKLAWLIFQISDNLERGGITTHPFLEVNFDCLVEAEPDALRTIVGRLTAIRRRYFQNDSRFILALDEAQVAARSYPLAFMSPKKPKKSRAILCKIVSVWVDLHFPTVKFIISGTGLSLASVNEVLASGAGKPAAEGFLVYHDVGTFNSEKSQRAYLARYVPQALLISPSGIALCKRMRNWLLGRHRFTSSFIELFLRHGFRSPHKLLNAYIESHANYAPLDYSLTLLNDEPDLQMKFTLQTFEWTKLNNDAVAKANVSMILHAHLVQNEPPSCGPVTARLVEYGIAQLRSDFQGQIREPLALVSCVRWYQTQKPFTLSDSVRMPCADSNTRGYAFEELVILYLTKAFRQLIRLDTVL